VRISQLTSTYFQSLPQALDIISRSHPKTIDMSLDRIKLAAERLNCLSFSIPVITVAGTNGKGSVSHSLEQFLTQSGYRVALYTSPHIWSFCERIRAHSKNISEEILLEIFNLIHQSLEEISLTYFEYSTLAALIYFSRLQSELDFIVFEVGMGGRLDAVNIVDPDLCVITSIDLDHQDWLGSDRASISLEKAGILRKNILLVSGVLNPPTVFLDKVLNLGVRAYQLGSDFSFREAKHSWSWSSSKLSFNDLSHPRLRMDNLSLVLKVLELLEDEFSLDIFSRISFEELSHRLASMSVAGRAQIISESPLTLIDVAHNPASCFALAERVKNLHQRGRVLALCSFMGDKPIVDSLRPFVGIVDYYLVAPMQDTRSATRFQLEDTLNSLGISAYSSFEDLKLAHEALISMACEADFIVIFGSFQVISEVLPC